MLQQFEDKGYKQFQTDTLHLRFEIISTGAFEAELNGALKLFGKRFSELTVGGHFGHVPVNMQWISTQDSLFLRTNGMDKHFANHDSLTKSIWIGMHRMGLLHNLARLTSLYPPDKMDGGVSTWVRADSVHQLEKNKIKFDIFVQNTPSDEASVLINPKCIFSRKTRTNGAFPGCRDESRRNL